MKKKLLLFSFSLFLLATTSYSQQYIPYYGSVVEQCSQGNITNNLTIYESLGLKRRGTLALDTTFNWLKSKYLSFGYSANQIDDDSYTYTGSSSVCKNLIVTKVGTVYPNIYIIVCGHYDSIGGTGTNDNGSGLVSILETARLLRSIPTEYSIKFINFSGEEDGLYGSKHYVDTVVNGTTPKMNIRLVINIDEVGGVADLINDTITCERDTNNSPSTNNALSTTMTNELIACVGLYSPLNAVLSYAYASDYMSFQANNETITGLFETNETTHKHTNTDLLINMDSVYNYKVAKVLIGTTMHFAAAATSTLGNQEYEDSYQVSFYPSPANDILNINLGSITETNYSFSLVDVQGKIAFRREVQNAHLIESIPLEGLSKGVYLAILQTATKRITKKIIVE
ncbi:M20/M25/M40 family metallo-hydrolase [Flavobacterium sp.]|uniref:M20/M25/M40 family metallo-hydrolase n=1 Tax=Flavobacterium sp. TaxID=239 RepID=UPI0025DA1169|nr:M20/M25/M40 family metallo-hydrolase [Flavobacterium sp.]